MIHLEKSKPRLGIFNKQDQESLLFRFDTRKKDFSTPLSCVED